MSARWWAFLVWALAAASAVYWGLKLFAPTLPVPAQAVLAQPGDGLKGDLARVWGADTPVAVAAEAAPPPTDTRFTLVGVLGPRQAASSKTAVALIAVDGKPAKAFRVGAVVEGQQVLQTVGARSATLGPRGGPTLISLTIPPPPEAARGTPAGADGAGVNPGAGATPPGQAPRPPAGFPATGFPAAGFPAAFPGQAPGQIIPPGGPMPNQMGPPITPQISPQMAPQSMPQMPPPMGTLSPQPGPPPLPVANKGTGIVRQPMSPRTTSPSATQSGEGQR